MKTLVIHPDDRTTDFLNIIYKDKGWKVITKRRMHFKDLMSYIRRYDRIIMMGHGCPQGLLGMTDYFMHPTFIKNIVKKETVCIWCNADEYVNRFGLKGFYTGMFISEVAEARWFGITTTQDKIDYSNNLFVENIKDLIGNTNILTEIKRTYSGDCPVIKYNNDRLYYRSDLSDLVETGLVRVGNRWVKVYKPKISEIIFERTFGI